MTILIVGNHQTNRKLLRAVLAATKFNVFEAADGVDALALLEREPVDAINWVATANEHSNC
jgi:CheY-like chemotaxis protein